MKHLLICDVILPAFGGIEEIVQKNGNFGIIEIIDCFVNHLFFVMDNCRVLYYGWLF